MKGDIGEKGMTGPKGDMGSGSGVVYIRWGRTTCPDGAKRVYYGRGAGSHYGTKGGTSDHLCLPETPQYKNFYSSLSYLPELYGVEYDLDEGTSSLLRHLFQADMPCVLCSVSTRSKMIMIPARYECPSDWNREYSGYLMSGAEHSGHVGSKSTICVDGESEAVPRSETNTNPAIVYFMRAVCNGLPCPPYEANKLLTCAVCTQ